MVKNLLIETKRLIIRPYHANDLEPSYRLMQDKELYQFLEFDVLSYEEYQGLFQWLMESYEVSHEGEFKYSFAIILKETNQVIGWCGIGILELSKPDKEVYYLIGRDHWGKGYAFEAMVSFLEYCFESLGQRKVVAKVNPENIASKRIIEKLGFRFEHILKDLPEEFSHCNGEWFYSIARKEALNLAWQK